MNGVTINEIHSDIWGMILSSVIIEKPTPKTSYIDIPFADGLVDISEVAGEIKYQMRKVTLSLQQALNSLVDFEIKAMEIANMYHGKNAKIILDIDQNYYYYGRLIITYSKDKGSGEIGIEALCYPYKLKNDITEQIEEVVATSDITLRNDRKIAYPKITTTAEFTIVKDGVTYSYGVVSGLQTTIPLFEGDNILNVTGTGTITFDWQEGAL